MAINEMMKNLYCLTEALDEELACEMGINIHKYGAVSDFVLCYVMEFEIYPSLNCSSTLAPTGAMD